MHFLPINTIPSRFKQDLSGEASPPARFTSSAASPGVAVPHFLALIFFSLSSAAMAQDATDAPGDSVIPAKLDIAAFPGSLVEKVVVPVPAEIFAVLDKLEQPNWAAQIKLPDQRGVESDRLRLALLFGATVGEGFVAVEAEQTRPIQEIGRRVLKLADALALQDAVVPHCQSIIDSAEALEWAKVREELDRTQQTVRNSMAELKDDELASLVSLGGWLRGTETLTNLISEAYNHDKAELLNQPDLVAHFRDSLTGMDRRIREHADVLAIEQGLGEIMEALSEAEGDEGVDTGGVVSAGTVKRIGEVCQSLLQRFYFDPKPETRSPN